MDDMELIQTTLKECSSLSLLYVEDDRAVSKNTYEILKPFFRKIDLAYDGEEGLVQYKKEGYDIVLTDIMMPKMDGREMSRKIRDINHDQAIMVMSAYDDSEYFRELIEIGISKFILKPPSLHQLLGSIFATAVNINNAKKIAQMTEGIKHDLAENKEMLRTIIDTVPVRIFWKDKESKYLGCNSLYAVDAGLNDPQQIIGKSDYDLSWKDEAQKCIEEDREIIASGKSRHNYEVSVTKDDGLQWLSMWKAALRGANNEIIGILGAYVDITEQKKALESIQKAKDALGYQAQHDALTGLPNRLLYYDRLRQAIKKVKRTRKKTAVVFIDIDRFKEINDSFGHEFGDVIVKMLGKRLSLLLREEDTIARFGGDEFTILIESVNGVSDVAEIVEKMIRGMEKPFVIDVHTLHLTLSAGISIYPDDASDPETMIRNADTAMYRAKDEGRNTYQFYTKEMTEKTLSHLMMAKDIRHAIDHDEFMVYYQPQMDGVTGRLIGMEALVRWKKPSGEMIPPNVFIPVAEESGLIDKIGAIVFTKAVTQIVQWYAQGHNPGRLAINLSTIELQQEDFVAKIEKRLAELGCKSEWIELEITEGYTMKHPKEAIKMLQDMKNLGIHLSIDDFGTGYSSLSYLTKLPVHKLKIDQSFVRNIPGNLHDEAIVQSVIFLAKTMDFDVIAEGVETEEQKSFLVQQGCRKIQGYFYAKPMDATEMEKYIEEYQTL